jgi:hypothetical protein
MNEEEQFESVVFAHQLTFRGCPFCELFGAEIGVLNAPESDFRLFARHLRNDHGSEMNQAIVNRNQCSGKIFLR